MSPVTRIIVISLLLCVSAAVVFMVNNDALATLKTSMTQQEKVERIAKLPSSGVSYEMAKRDSAGFFTDISDEHWILMRERVKNRKNYHIGPRHGIERPNVWYQENFEPDFTCAHERRIGDPPSGDGPKWVCDPHRLQISDCLVYSVGSAGNFMFENGIMKTIGKHCEIHTFDPELSGAAYGSKAQPGVNYHNWGLMPGSAKSLEQQKYFDHKLTGGNFKSLNETIKELGHVGRTIDIFKIDCEGCEWTTFQGWFTAGAILKQILVEVHNSPKDLADNFFTTLQKQGYVTFHKEPNIQYAGGNCVEYAFLKLESSFFDQEASS